MRKPWFDPNGEAVDYAKGLSTQHAEWGINKRCQSCGEDWPCRTRIVADALIAAAFAPQGGGERTDAEKDYADMRRSQEQFIAADHRAREWRQRVKLCHELLARVVGYVDPERSTLSAALFEQVWAELKPCDNLNECPTPSALEPDSGSTTNSQPKG